MSRKWSSFEKWSTGHSYRGYRGGRPDYSFRSRGPCLVTLGKTSRCGDEGASRAAAFSVSRPDFSAYRLIVTHNQSCSTLKPESERQRERRRQQRIGKQKRSWEQQSGPDPAPVAIAPNGIAIAGGNVTNPTVNNFAPPTPPPAVIHLCISPPKAVEGATAEVKQIFTLTTDSNVEGPTYVFDFSDNITERTAASSPDMAMNIGEKQTGPSQFGFRLYQTWFPGQRITSRCIRKVLCV